MDIGVLTEFFAFVDADHDGFITIEQIKEVCNVDTTTDGNITEDERMLYAMAAKWLVWVNEQAPLQNDNNDPKLSLARLVAYNQ